MKKNVVILYSSYNGDGPTEALSEYFADEYVDCNFVAIEETRYANLFSSRFTAALYKWTIRNAGWLNGKPKLIREKFMLRKGNGEGTETVNAENKSASKEENKEESFKKLRIKLRKVDNIFLRFKPDVVICFTPRSLKKAVEAKARLGADTTVLSMSTDYVFNRSMLDFGADGFIAQNVGVRASLENNGVSSDTIFVGGSPVPHRITETVERDAAREFFHIEADLPTVTLIGGRFGCGVLKDAFSALAEYSDRINLILLTGGGEGLKRFAESYCKSKNLTQNIYIIPDKCDMAKLYSVSDVIATSPTSGTVAECLEKRLPFVLLKSVNASEKGNSDYLTSHGLAMRGQSKEELATAVLEYLNTPQRVEAYKTYADQYVDCDCTRKIAEVVHDTAEKVENMREKVLSESDSASFDGAKE